MKILVVYYSRTGTTKTVAEKLAESLTGEIVLEEIRDTVDRSGVAGYLRSGRDASLKRLPSLQPVKNRPEDFDLVVVGTPIWAWTMSAPTRAYLTNFAGKIKNTVFFCTMGGSGDQQAFAQMGKICQFLPVATLALLTKEVVAGDFSFKVNEFATKLQKYEV